MPCRHCPVRCWRQHDRARRPAKLVVEKALDRHSQGAVGQAGIRQFYDRVPVGRVAEDMDAQGLPRELAAAVLRHQLLSAVELRVGLAMAGVRSRSSGCLTGSPVVGALGRALVRSVLAAVSAPQEALGFRIGPATTLRSRRHVRGQRGGVGARRLGGGSLAGVVRGAIASPLGLRSRSQLDGNPRACKRGRGAQSAPQCSRDVLLGPLDQCFGQLLARATALVGMRILRSAQYLASCVFPFFRTECPHGRPRGRPPAQMVSRAGRRCLSLAG